jgi:hypothetical protein
LYLKYSGIKKLGIIKPCYYAIPIFCVLYNINYIYIDIIKNNSVFELSDFDSLNSVDALIITTPIFNTGLLLS